MPHLRPSFRQSPGLDFTTTISTINFVLLFIGYPFAVILFTSGGAGISTDSQSVTVPYRAFALFITCLTLFANIGSRVKINTKITLLLLYWCIFLIRAFYDLEIQTAIQDNTFHTTERAWAYILLINLLPTLTILKSFSKINLHHALNWIILIGTTGLIISLRGNDAILTTSPEETSRIDYGEALNTISYGHLGGLVAIASFCALCDKSRGIIQKALLLSATLLGCFILLRAGSRGPLVALLSAGIVWGAARSRLWIINGALLLTITALIILFKDSILNFIGKISPVLQNRFEAAIIEGDTSGREFDLHWGYFLDNIWIGTRSELLGYAHNIIIDALKGMGVFGGILMTTLIVMGIAHAFLFTKNRQPHIWIGLILVQQIAAHMTSGCFSDNPLLSALLMIAFLSKLKSDFPTSFKHHSTLSTNRTDSGQTTPSPNQYR